MQTSFIHPTDESQLTKGQYPVFFLSSEAQKQADASDGQLYTWGSFGVSNILYKGYRPTMNPYMYVVLPTGLADEIELLDDVEDYEMEQA